MAELGQALIRRPTRGLFSDLIPADRDAVLTSMMRENIRPATIRAAGYIGAETDLRPVLPTINVPTLILHGAADVRSPLANAEALHAAIRRPSLLAALQARPCVCGGGPRGVRGGDSPVRGDHRLNPRP